MCQVIPRAPPLPAPASPLGPQVLAKGATGVAGCRSRREGPAGPAPAPARGMRQPLGAPRAGVALSEAGLCTLKSTC